MQTFRVKIDFLHEIRWAWKQRGKQSEDAGCGSLLFKQSSTYLDRCSRFDTWVASAGLDVTCINTMLLLVRFSFCLFGLFFILFFISNCTFTEVKLLGTKSQLQFSFWRKKSARTYLTVTQLQANSFLYVPFFLSNVIAVY